MKLEWTRQRNRVRPTARASRVAIQTAIDELIDALRLELTDYGGMLVLLNEQEDLILEHSAAGLLENVAALRAQMELVAANRKRRNERSDTLAFALGLAASSSICALIGQLPREYQPLLRALVEEINDLLLHCQQRVIANNVLITRQSPPLRGITGELRFDAFAV